MYQTILVPLDGSLFGEHALPIACELARRAGATLRLVHVHALSASPIYVKGHAVIDKDLVPLSHEQTSSVSIPCCARTRSNKAFVTACRD